METLLGVAKLLFWLGLAILVHEFGHYIAARWAGIKVLKFSLGIPPRLFGFKRGDTEYVVQALPIGGYVKLAGEEWEDGRTPKPHELMAKPARVRILVYSAGVVMNFAMAWLLFYAHLIRGVEFGSAGNEIGSVLAGSAAARAGFRPGDRIVAVDGAPVDHWFGLGEALDRRGAGNRAEVRVRRGGAETVLRLTVTPTPGLEPAVPAAVVGEVAPMSPARKAGFRAGDRIVAIGGVPVREWMDISPLIRKTGEREVAVRVRRGTETVSLRVVPKMDPREHRPIIGISPAYPYMVRRSFGPVESASAALSQVVAVGVEIPKAIWLVISGRAALRDVVGGPVLITRIGVEKAKQGFWELVFFVAVLNVQLLVFNLLPVPVLDGGMILLAVLEGMRRRRFSVRTYERLTTVGAGLLLLLVVYATIHDIRR